MTNWFCKTCPVTRDDCGPWDDNDEYFKNILFVHKNHAGFQVGEPTNVETEATNFFNENIHQWLHAVIGEQKGPDKVCQIKDKWKWVSQT